MASLLACLRGRSEARYVRQPRKVTHSQLKSRRWLSVLTPVQELLCEILEKNCGFVFMMLARLQIQREGFHGEGVYLSIPVVLVLFSYI